ncbi:MAG TPA: M1 family peptidase, partial [Acidimicrobiia bacterium]|nr:M1 family peptidase [Acidimicrobiia bacterium]
MTRRTLALLTGLALALGACSNDRAAPLVPPQPTAPPTTVATTVTTVAATAPPGSGSGSGTEGGVTQPVDGADGLGDPYYPGLGNGGYDVIDYDLTLDVTPPAALDGVAVITALATLPLRSFHLDLEGLEVRDVEVGGRRASFVREDRELIVTPEEPLDPGAEFTVRIEYGGTPRTGRLDSAALDNGWVVTRGVSYVIGQPDAARTWFPANDHPTDKATFS